MPFYQTSPISYFDREVQSKPRVPDIVLAFPLPLVCLGGVCKRNRGYRGSNVSIGRERVAGALLIASEAAGSSKASRADVRIMKRLASSSPSSTTFGWGTTSPCFVSSPWTFISWPKTRVAGGMPQPPCPLVQCVGNFVADDRHGTPTLSPGVAKPVVPATSLMVAILSSTRPLLPRRMGCCGLHRSP